MDGSPIGGSARAPLLTLSATAASELPLEHWRLLQEVGRLAVYFTAQAGESERLKGDIQSVLDTWAGHAEEVVASNRV